LFYNVFDLVNGLQLSFLNASDIFMFRFFFTLKCFRPHTSTEIFYPIYYLNQTGVTVLGPNLPVSLAKPFFFYNSNVVVVFGGTNYDLVETANDIIYFLNMNSSTWTTINPQLSNYSGIGIQDLALDYFNAPSMLFTTSNYMFLALYFWFAMLFLNLLSLQILSHNVDFQTSTFQNYFQILEMFEMILTEHYLGN
jgi:hypothetical protein